MKTIVVCTLFVGLFLGMYSMSFVMEEANVFFNNEGLELGIDGITDGSDGILGYIVLDDGRRYGFKTSRGFGRLQQVYAAEIDRVEFVE